MRFAWIRVLGQAVLPVAIAKGFDRDFGIRLEQVNYGTAPEMAQSIVTGGADAAFGAIIPTAASMLIAGAKIRTVGIYAYGGDRTALVVLSPQIQTVRDLVGRTVATIVGSTPEAFLDRLLQESGIAPETVKRANVPNSDMPAALVTNQVQAVTVTEPILSTILQKEPTARVLARGGKYICNCGGIFMPENTLKAADGRAFGTYLALIKAAQYIRQKGADSDEIVGIVAAATGATPASVKSGFAGVMFDPRLKDWTWTRESDLMQYYLDQKKLPRAVSRADLFDETLQNRALGEHPALFADIRQYLTANKASPAELDIR